MFFVVQSCVVRVSIKKTKIDTFNAIETKWDKGLVKCLEICIQKDKDESISEGLEKGEHIMLRLLCDSSKKTAEIFLKMGLSIEQVGNSTGLTIEEVKSLL